MGLLFAFMPVLATAAGGSNEYDLVLLLSVMARVVAKLAVLAVGALVLARTVLPPAWRWLARRFGPESFQLASIAFCLLCALTTARQGVSAELGAFAAGVMLSATEQQEAVLHHLGELLLLRLVGAVHSVCGWICRTPADCMCQLAGVVPPNFSCQLRTHPSPMPARTNPCPAPSVPCFPAEPVAQFFLALFVSCIGLVLSPCLSVRHVLPPTSSALQSRLLSSSWPSLSPPPAWCSAPCSCSTTCPCWPAALWRSLWPKRCWCAGEGGRGAGQPGCSQSLVCTCRLLLLLAAATCLHMSAPHACLLPQEATRATLHFPVSAPQIAGVVAMFRYPADTALAVGINLSQVRRRCCCCCCRHSWYYCC